MSSSPTELTSTTGSSTVSPSRADPSALRDARSARSSGTIALIACGAIAQPAFEVVARNGWPVDVHPLPPLLHNRPRQIATEVERLARELGERYDSVVVGYAECGTLGALDEVCARLSIRRLPGLHCYDVYAGEDRMRAALEAEPGTYLLTDFLVRSFRRTVVAELGLDRYPELREDYFGHYTRVVWLAQHADPELEQMALEAAATLGLPLTVVPTGLSGLERALASLL